MSYRDIPQLIRSWKESVDEAGLREIDTELRSASFLVWAGDGTYGFSHRSFQEYFLAAHLISEAIRGEAKPWSRDFLRPEVYRFIRDLLARRGDAATVLIAWIGRNDLSATCRANAIKSASVVPGQETRIALLQVLASGESQALRRYAATGLGYHPDASSIAVLVSAAKHDPDQLLRNNALLALGRMGTPEAAESLLGLLNLASGNTESKVAYTALFYREAKAFKGDELVAALINKSMEFIEGRFLLFSCLELCRARWSPEAQAYCEKVAEVTNSVRGFAEAIDLLPPEVKIRYVPRASELIQKCIKMPIAEKLILALRGIRDPKILPILLDLARQKSSRNASAALEVLFSDFPVASRDIALNLLRQPHCHLNVRMKILDGIVSSAKPEELDQIEESVLCRGRVIVRIHFLQLCRTHCPERLPRLILQHWDGQPVPVKCHMIESLWLTDRVSAKRLIIERGIDEPRVGTRVAAARALGADASSEATEALLRQAACDDSKWVRVQAVRSLLAPGRTLTAERLREVMQNESDVDVLQVRQELLGW